MKRIRYFNLLMLLLSSSIGLWGQSNDFNPVSPAEPGPPGSEDGSVPMLTLVAEPSDGGTVTGAGWYETGTKLTLKAVNKANFAFSRWTNEAGETISTESQFQYTKLSGDETLTAHFRFSPGNPAEPTEIAQQIYYQLTVKAEEGGTVSGGGKYLPGTRVYVSASVSTGYSFAGWYNTAGERLATTTGYYYTTTTNAETLTARFTLNPFNPSNPSEPTPITPTPHVQSYQVTAFASDGGTVNTGSTTLTEGNSVTLTATANTGYVFQGWYVADTLYTTQRSFTYTMKTSDVAFEARFVFNPTAPSDPSMPSTKKYAFYLMNYITKPGTKVEFPVYLTNLDVLGNITFQLTFDPALRPDLKSVAIPDKIAGYEVTKVALNDTTYMFQFDGGEVSAGNTPLLFLSVYVPDDVATARGYPIKINQVTVTEGNGNETTASTRNGRVSVYKLGDTNGDDVVDLMDKMNLVSVLLGERPDVFIEEVADVNDDGATDQNDADAILEIFKTNR